MAKTNRREAAKRLKQAIDACTDPEQLIKLTNALAKLLPKPKQPRRPRKPAVTKARPITKSGRLSKRVETGSAVDRLSDAEWLRHDMVVTYEKLSREQRFKLGRQLTEGEKESISKEVVATFSEEELAAINSLTPSPGTRRGL